MYIMAEKFLNGKDLEQFKEEVKMTRLGQMLINDGIETGIEKGIENFIKLCKEFNLSQSDTLTRVVNEFKVSFNKAKTHVEKYW